MTMIDGYPGSVQRNGRGRVGLFECECGCGQVFLSEYKTRRPRYTNKTHRARAYRDRARARAIAYDVCSRAEYAPAELFDEVFATEYYNLYSKRRGT